jgi:mono/diheme cytochrome c family protein
MRTLAALSALLAVAAVACATASSGGAPAGSPEAAGEELYRGHCGACHRLRDPAEQTRDRWAWAVDRYGSRAHLSAGERQLVLGYLQSHAKDAAPAATEAR